MTKFFDGAAEIISNESETSVKIFDQLSPEELKELSQFLAKQKITKINLTLKNGVEFDDGLLALVAETNPSAFKLDYFPRGFKEKTLKNLAVLISSSETLKSLDLSGLLIRDKGVGVLCEAIINSSLEKLNLSNNRIGQSAERPGITEMESTFFLLQNSKSLTEVNLSLNDFEREGLKMIAFALRPNNTLRDLNLIGNRIETHSKAIKAGLEEGKDVKSLQRYDEETRTALDSLQHGSLRTLHLSGNLIDQEFARYLNSKFPSSNLETLTLSHQGSNEVGKDSRHLPASGMNELRKSPQASTAPTSVEAALGNDVQEHNQASA